MDIHLDFGISPKTFRQTYLYQKPKLFKERFRISKPHLGKISTRYTNEQTQPHRCFICVKKVQSFLKKNTSKVSTIWAKLATVLLNPLSTNI